MQPLTTAAPAPVSPEIDSLFFSAAQIATFEHDRGLTNASGFFFERDGRLWLVTSRHVLIDAPTKHFPNRIEIKIHTSRTDLTQSGTSSMLIYLDGKAMWRQGKDSGGEIDVAMLEIDRAALPVGAVLHPFTPEHLLTAPAYVGIGSSVLILGFPLGFHDTVYNLPVVRQSVIASAFGIRFQGKGYFLTDARMHRGMSGAPVVLRDPGPDAGVLPWKLLGVHSASLDMANRDQIQDETLGLNCAWYADILMTLSEPSS